MRRRVGGTLLTVVLATYRRPRPLRDAVESLLSQCDVEFELIVADQTECDWGGERIEDVLSDLLQDERVSLHHLGTPSLPAARNFALTRARGEIIVFMDDDAVASPGFLAAHARAYEDSGVSAVAGRIRHPGAAGNEMLARRSALGRGRGGFDVSVDAPSTALLRGCNMSFRVAVLRDVGGFDPNFAGNAWAEDVDAAMRVVRAGHRITYVAGALVDHYALPYGGCHEGMDDERVWIHRNEMLLFLKNGRRYLLPLFVVAQLRQWVLNGPTIRRRTLILSFSAFVRGSLRGFVAWRQRGASDVVAGELSLVS